MPYRSGALPGFTRARAPDRYRVTGYDQWPDPPPMPLTVDTDPAWK